MISNTIAYSKERSPFLFVLVLSLLLFTPGVHSFPSFLTYFVGLISMALFLFLIRLSDDICDIPIDRVTHPERFLCGQHVSIKKLNQFRILAIFCLLLLQGFNLPALIFVCLTIIIFGVFFLVKPSLPTLIHTALLNASLAVFPLYAGVYIDNAISSYHLLTGLFFWVGGFAHDLSHSVQNTQGVHQEKLNPINRINQRYLARLSLVFFIIATAVGFYMYYTELVGIVFLAVLLIMFVAMLILEIRLIKNPNEGNAKPFYFFGFLYFLLPSFAHLLSNILV